VAAPRLKVADVYWQHSQKNACNKRTSPLKAASSNRPLQGCWIATRHLACCACGRNSLGMTSTRYRHQRLSRRRGPNWELQTFTFANLIVLCWVFFLGAKLFAPWSSIFQPISWCIGVCIDVESAIPNPSFPSFFKSYAYDPWCLSQIQCSECNWCVVYYIGRALIMPEMNRSKRQ
jgi:hypothetical protein